MPSLLVIFMAQAADPAACADARQRAGLSSFAKDRACAVFQPERVFEGVFFDDFEGQVFREGAKDASDKKLGPSTWLHVELSHAARARWNMAGDMCGHAYRLRFTGAATMPLPLGGPAYPQGNPFPRGYGHLGAFERLVSVDRLLAVADLGERYHACGPPPPGDKHPLKYP